ncbi:ribokinase [Planctomycetota bacterium]
MTGRIPKIVVVGDTFVDVVIRCSHVPAPGQSVIGNSLSYTLAGHGPNPAAEAALCGCEVYLISKIGGDPFAQMVLTSLKEHKINTDYVFTAEAKNTGMIVTMVNSEGENATCNYAGANSVLMPQDIEAAEGRISEADVCLIHGGLPQDAIVTAVKLAKVHRTKVILNPARPIEQKGRVSDDLPIEYFSADILIPNLDEAADITESMMAGTRTAKLIGSDLIARGVKCAVITLGKRGCMVVDRDGADNIPAFEVELVDQTGRGDAFTGALAAYCAVENDIRGAAKFASAAGALACTKFGSVESLPTKAEIIQLLQMTDTD